MRKTILICKLIGLIILITSIYYLGYRCGGPRSHQDVAVFVYDSPIKVRNFYAQIERSFALEGIPSSMSENAMREFKKLPPLVAVGPLIIFNDKNSGDYCIREQDSLATIAEWTTNAVTTKKIRYSSKVEKEWQYPRIEYSIWYSDDGYYEKNGVVVFDKIGNIVRSYFDTNGDGFLNKMDVFDHNNELHTSYMLDGLTYIKIAERPFGSTINEYQGSLVVAPLQVVPAYPKNSEFEASTEKK